MRAYGSSPHLPGSRTGPAGPAPRRGAGGVVRRPRARPRRRAGDGVRSSTARAWRCFARATPCPRWGARGVSRARRPTPRGACSRALGRGSPRALSRAARRRQARGGRVARARSRHAVRAHARALRGVRPHARGRGGALVCDVEARAGAGLLHASRAAPGRAAARGRRARPSGSAGFMAQATPRRAWYIAVDERGRCASSRAPVTRQGRRAMAARERRPPRPVEPP